MKKKKTSSLKNILIFIGIIVLVALWIFFKLFLKGIDYPNSFRNDGFTGNMLFYDTLKELSYEVKYSLEPIQYMKEERLVVLNIANRGDLEEELLNEIEKYANQGGNILVLFNGYEAYQDIDMESMEKIREDGIFQVFEKWKAQNNGVLMFGNIKSLSNFSIAEDRENGYRALEMMHPYMKDEGVVFNEYYLFRVEGRQSLWQSIPTRFKYIFYQLGLVAILIIWLLGKRFGAPLKLYEEEEHAENAYTLAVGQMFYRGKHWEELLDAYFRDFLQKLNKKHYIYGSLSVDNFDIVYEKENKKDLKRALTIKGYMQEYYKKEPSKKNKKSKKEVKEVLIAIQKLEGKLGIKEEKKWI